MTDYNDGNWHGHNGSQCPVHPQSLVEVVIDAGRQPTPMVASGWIWDSISSPIRAFRVVKVHREPREFWMLCNDGEDPIVVTGPSVLHSFDECIHVREVLD